MILGSPAIFTRTDPKSGKVVGTWQAVPLETESCLFPVLLKPGVFCIGKLHV